MMTSQYNFFYIMAYSVGRMGGNKFYNTMFLGLGEGLVTIAAGYLFTRMSDIKAQTFLGVSCILFFVAF